MTYWRAALENFAASQAGHIVFGCLQCLFGGMHVHVEDIGSERCLSGDRGSRASVSDLTV